VAIAGPVLNKYRNWQKRAFGMSLSYQDRTVPEANEFPLLFAPGEGWEYSTGVDWAGLMVERVNGNITLDEYMKKNVWAPLGIELLTFHPYQNPEVKARLGLLLVTLENAETKL
jgi:CubicO group peptidase (beta-lactamase class C family)